MKQATIKSFLFSTSALLLLLTVNAFVDDRSIPAADTRPNIIIIITDDQGYGDVGFNGCSDIQTPNIDKIAANGVVFTQAYVTYAVCAPSRAGLLTGRYQDRFGYSRNPLYKPNDPNQGLSLEETLLPQLLQQHNYTTMAIGKWHLGAHEKYRPWNRGFDTFFGFLGGGHRYHPNEYTIANEDSAKNEAESYKTKLTRNGVPVDETMYITDAFSREAVNFIKRSSKQPFFLYLAYNAPHAPLQATESYLKRYEHVKDTKRRTYAAMVSAVDDGVGVILATLQEQGIADNTIVIFLSDNGGPKQDNASDNGHLRGGKGTLFEGGIRVPFAMQWPMRIKSHTTYTKPVSSLDIFATIADELHITSQVKKPLDGVNLLPFINGLKNEAPHNYLYWRQYDQKRYAVLHASGLKLHLSDTSKMLFNVSSDIGEHQNIIQQEASNSSMLLAKKNEWEAQMIPPQIWGLNQEKQYQFGKKP
ncbi:MAG TPA: N-acetylgalactosamine 6-sulfate sulfatase [Chitinophagaceae bacterium]|nr:N-acetylgalactosamine 6-sulfate sulfatase [Chitinophagaceae bacterium]HAN38112.1 N-acetylgalactosamine 6-sulfate sulfatase [Chitinophagaceae bacterium]